MEKQLNFQNGGDVVPIMAVVEENGANHWTGDWPEWPQVGQTGYGQRISGQICRTFKSVRMGRWPAKCDEKLRGKASPAQISNLPIVIPGRPRD